PHHRRKMSYACDVAKDLEFKKDLHIFNWEKLIIDKIDGFQQKLLGYDKKRIAVSGNVQRIVEFLNVLFQAVTYLFLGIKVFNNHLSIGDFTRGISALMNFMSISVYLTPQMLNINDSTFYLHKYKSFLNTRSKNDSEEECRGLEDVDPDNVEIEFKDVSFRYPNSTNYVLKHVNLKIKHGKKLAIVGYNGAGKTSLILLLMRFYDPTDGKILLNGVDIRNIKYKDYIKLFSSVNQDFSLMAFSIAENVSCKPSMSAEEKEKIEELVKQNGMAEKMKKMYRGIDTPVTKVLEPSGIDFSGGEKQCIAISRALYKNTPILVMDEPTSSLDPIAEQKIYKKFSEMSDGRTSVFVSHRIYSTKFCDNIAVFEKGEMVEYGSFEELINNKGLFYSFYKQQADYFLNDKER
ncbi:MAG: ABC transporter ATP-binding protein/permease, partial [Lachnospiraceae bacterium]|nr:ABC transporter ATP-binding protein/permease [Lachnospiraceae bacterium]